MSLGNEVNQFSASNHPDPDELTVEQAEDWTGAMFEAARLGAPAGMHTVANYDAAWFMDDHVFTPDQSARFGDATVVLSWIFDGTGQRYGYRSYGDENCADDDQVIDRGFQPTVARTTWPY